MAGKPKGDAPRLGVAIRLTPSEKELLIKHFGGVQAAVDSLLERLKKASKKTRSDPSQA